MSKGIEIMKQTDGFVTVLDSNGVAVHVSDEFAAKLGYTTCELEGQNLFEFIHPACRDEIFARFQRSVQHGSTVMATYRFKAKSGEWVKFHSKAIPFYDDGGLKRSLIVSREQQPIDIRDIIALVDCDSLVLVE